MAQRKVTLSEPQRWFAQTLFDTYPSFLPTQSLYVDLEGTGRRRRIYRELVQPAKESRVTLRLVRPDQ